MLPVLLLLLSLQAACTASPIAAPPGCSHGSPQRCPGLRALGPVQGPPATAEVRAPFPEPGQPKLNFISRTPSHLACDVCTVVVGEVQGRLGGDSSEEAVHSALRQACRRLPRLLRTECASLVDRHGSDLAPLVTQDTPEKVCRAVAACSAPKAPRSLGSTRASRPLAFLDEEDQGAFCDSCRKLLDMSASNLQSKSMQRGILMAFRGGCRILPLPYRVQCGRFVADYEPVLIASLVNVMEPTAVCTKVGACRAPQPLLLGTDQCVAGPSFWCQSKRAAELCNATQHCQEHVWREAHV